ncbi:MAG: MotA/TolQ/ExbB proton channel family protein [Bacteroidales bacterium]|jgi:biopolymer transport protein ExbB|nr:MotA/TolQ/ExbB proton channel family protein [Bacteroidales bacterium]MDI9575232.1 MotA/TolQ/ExbB proton channel family protein [Bacteroidota bacterium]MDD3756360.1 MotA/TolQ/ExbB proton channel family protein [Bacteroidales bacterium]MDY0401288.1 MotA/TolQ/ExbB proton channel family protein [Bacteroidales bacterium]HHW59667.1 MotA/TolQ/ExbB proton channel family protein [Bacteroidales bacterium]
MKKIATVLVILTVSFGISVFAQDKVVQNENDTQQVQTEAVDTAAAPTLAAIDQEQQEEAEAKPTFHQVLKQKFIEGGVGWMTPILLCLILGLAISIERIIYLSLARTNSKALLEQIEKLVLEQKDIEKAKELCRNTRGPIASVFYQGLLRFNESLENIEKAIASYGSVQMGHLESNLTWLSLFIAIAPSLGFLGTVVGMVSAFDAIEAAGDISPTIVAGGMKVALLTTVFGLITALILQVFFNYIVSQIETIVNDMEDSTITFMDIISMAKNNQ